MNIKYMTIKQNNLQKKRILLLAPQPFFQERGTPIAVKLITEELVNLDFEIHLLVFNEGEEITIEGATIHRIPSVPGINNIQPSFSWKKIVCDFLMFFTMLRLIRKYDFTLFHAVEESVFLALPVSFFTKIPYIYDMDSSLVIQVIDKYPILKPIYPVLTFFEKISVRNSIGVIAVCKELEEIARKYDQRKNIIRLEDISMLDEKASSDENLREKYDINGPIILYVGNLEEYQGIDLLLESFHLVRKNQSIGNLVIIGGTRKKISYYQKYAENLGIAANTYFCGKRPVDLLSHYLKQADILVSPRTQGNNTPMKLYSYLASGKAIIATNLPTHTQVLNDECAYLSMPDKQSMADAMLCLLNDPELAKKIGENGKLLAKENYSLKSFRKKLKTFYSDIIKQITNQLQG